MSVRQTSRARNPAGQGVGRAPARPDAVSLTVRDGLKGLTGADAWIGCAAVPPELLDRPLEVALEALFERGHAARVALDHERAEDALDAFQCVAELTRTLLTTVEVTVVDD